MKLVPAFLVGLLFPTIVILALVTKTPAAPIPVKSERLKTVNDLIKENDPLIKESECFAYWNKYRAK